MVPKQQRLEATSDSDSDLSICSRMLRDLPEEEKRNIDPRLLKNATSNKKTNFEPEQKNTVHDDLDTKRVPNYGMHIPDWAYCTCMACIAKVKPLNTYVPDMEHEQSSGSEGSCSSRHTKKRKKTGRQEAIKKEKKIKKLTGEIKKDKKKATYKGPKEPPGLPEHFKTRIQALGATSDPVMLIQKQLYDTDISSNHGRLSIPASKVRGKGILTEEEEARLERLGHAEKNNNTGMKLDLIDTGLLDKRITFKQWNIFNKNAIYVLSTVWNELVKSNRLRTGNIVQVWSFRVGLVLRLALVMVDAICVDDPEYESRVQMQNNEER